MIDGKINTENNFLVDYLSELRAKGRDFYFTFFTIKGVIFGL